MRYLIIATSDANGHPTRVNIKGTEAEAQALVEKLKTDMPPGKEAPDAFYIVDPLVDVRYLTADHLTKTVSIDTVKEAEDTTSEDARQQIGLLEGAVTQRRMREAVTTQAGKDWLIAQETAIGIERGKIK